MISWFGLWLGAAMAAEPQLTPALDQANWQISGDRQQCRMQQQLGDVASLAFVQQAAAPVELQLTMQASYLQLQDVQGQVVSSGWQVGHTAPAVRFSPTYLDPTRAVFTEQVPQVLQQLQQGHWLKLALQLPGEDLVLLVPNLKSASAMVDFQQCLSALLPLSWQQAREYQLFYPEGQRQPSAEDLAYLRLLARYVREDQQVRKVLLDGYADDMGTSLADRLMSEERADEVAAHLIEAGVARNKIELRAHGSRYPAATGSGAQSPNRRVLIRLIRSAKPVKEGTSS